MTDINSPLLQKILKDLIHTAVQEAIEKMGLPDSTPAKLIYREDEVCSLVGVCPSTLRNYTDPDGRWFDPTFPKPIRLGNGSAKRTAIGWRRADIIKWVNSRPAHETPHQLNKRKAKLMEVFDLNKPRSTRNQWG